MCSNGTPYILLDWCGALSTISGWGTFNQWLKLPHDQLKGNFNPMGDFL
jgi:hypothetical protein